MNKKQEVLDFIEENQPVDREELKEEFPELLPRPLTLSKALKQLVDEDLIDGTKDRKFEVLKNSKGDENL